MTTIDYHYFSRLSFSEQTSHTALNGVCVGIRISEEEVYLLYSVASFYVELKFCKVQLIFVCERYFYEPDLLEPYLDDIDLSLLFPDTKI